MFRPVRLAAWLPILALFFAPTLPTALAQTPPQIYRPEITAAEIHAEQENGGQECEHGPSLATDVLSHE